MLISELFDAICWEISVESGSTDFQLVDDITDEWIIFCVFEHRFSMLDGLFIHCPWAAAARPARVFSFAPRIKNIGKQRLYVFRGHNRRDRGSWKVTPDNYITDALVRGNWDDLLRLVTTIKLKENTASDIFRRLNSYSRQHALYQTLKAFGQIIKSIFILRYIDDLELRQAIAKQINKIELANRFTRAVAVGNPREFTQAEKEEQEIAEACNRLIKNSIICWNYLYLARQLEKAPDAETRKNILRLTATRSPMSWAHINMLGEYDFSEEKLRDAPGILPLKSVA